MKPPICELCDRDFRDELGDDESSGGLVRFTDFEDLEAGIIGQTKGLAWFCEKHIQSARSFSDLSLPKALKIMQDEGL